MASIHTRKNFVSTCSPQSARAVLNSSALSPDSAKNKLFKSSVTLNSPPTATSVNSISNSPRLNTLISPRETGNSLTRISSEDRIKTAGTPIKTPLSHLSLSINTKLNISPGFSPTPLLREALTHYATKTINSQRSVPSSPARTPTPQELQVKMSPTIETEIPMPWQTTSTPSTPLKILVNDLPLQLRTSSISMLEDSMIRPQSATDRQLSINDSIKSGVIKSPRPTSSDLTKNKPTPVRAIKIDTPKKSSFALDKGSPKNGSKSPTKSPKAKSFSQAENSIKSPKKPKITDFSVGAGTPKKDKNKIAEPSKRLNEIAKDEAAKGGNSETMIASLTDEISNLKVALSKFQEENTKLKEASLIRDSTMDSSGSFVKGSNFKEMIDEIKRENYDIKKTMEFLRDENEVLKKSLLDVTKCQEETQYYKNLAESKYKECTSLSQELLNIKTDLTKPSSPGILKVQRTKSVSVSIKGEEMQNPIKSRRSSLKKEKKSSFAKKGVSWKEELVEKSPKKKAT